MDSHILNIKSASVWWGSIYEKVNKHWDWVEKKCVAYKSWAFMTKNENLKCQ